jgi:hypothetical protein
MQHVLDRSCRENYITNIMLNTPFFAHILRPRATLYVGLHCHSFSHTVKCVLNNVNPSSVICALFEHFIL